MAAAFAEGLRDGIRWIGKHVEPIDKDHCLMLDIQSSSSFDAELLVFAR